MTEHRGPILFASNPSAGLINCVLAMAGEVNRRGGADLWFASTEDRSGDVWRLPGAERVRFVSVGEHLPAVDPVSWPDETHRALIGESRLRRYTTFLDHAFDAADVWAKYERLLAEIDRIRPALMVVDSSTGWALDAAMVRGVPYVMTVPLPASGAYLDRLPWGYPAPFSGLPGRMGPRQRIANVAFRIGSRLAFFTPSRLRMIAENARRRKGADLPNVAAAPSRYADGAEAVLSTMVPELEYPFPGQEKVTMLGAVLPEEDGAAAGDDGGELAAWLDRHESIVYIGFGTIMRPTAAQVKAIVEMCERLGDRHQVLWRLPAARHELLPEKPPGNLRVETWLPSQLAVLAHPNVRVFFNHAGGNAVTEGLYFGKPLLVLPFWMDCHDYAVRAVDSGAALALDQRESGDAEVITAKLERLLAEDGFRDAARAIADSQRGAGGVRAAADLIERAAAAAARPAPDPTAA
ncbi:glycosyltransferase [Actinomadura rugatobispora]|uniref:Glycosyltransferase n=1 Tax=Actinomadura rugatobispora TaxID=1994 RepID=A0ABW1AA94_9ACTN|nr:hypothetical protein GCM10010200_001230 [Actinomadura rugatobispora]